MNELKTLKEISFNGYRYQSHISCWELKKELTEITKSMDMSSSQVMTVWGKVIPKDLDIVASLIAIKSFIKYWGNLNVQEKEL